MTAPVDLDRWRRHEAIRVSFDAYREHTRALRARREKAEAETRQAGSCG